MGAQESSERGRVPSSWLQSLNGKRSTTLKSAIEAARTDTWNRDAELVFCTQEYFASKVLGLKINTSASISSPGTTMTCRSSGNDLHNLGKKGTAVLFCVLDLSNTDHDEEAQAAVAGGLSAGEASTKIAEKYRSNVFIFRVVSPGQTQHQGHQEGTTNSNSRHGNGEANNAISTGPQPLPFGEIVFQKERTSKSGNIALLHDCGYQTYAQRLEFAEQVADLNFDTQSAYDKVQRALKYLTKPGVLQSGKSLLKTCQPPVDLETPMLRPMNPGEDFVLKDGKVFLVVYSRQKPTYYDLSLAGSEKRLNLTYSRTRFSGSLALGSGDQLGSENVPGGTTCPMLVHEFEFRPECLPFPPCGAEEESQGIGCVLFSGYQSTKLKAWSRDRPIVMLMHVDSDGLNTCYYCPAPMNDRIGESITYGAISFQVVRNTGGGSTSLGQLLFEGKMRKKKKLKMSLSGLKSRFAEKENEIDAADENKEEPAASDEGESQDEEQWTHKLRFYLHTAQEGYCPRGLDKSAPVSAACYKHYFETAEAYFATAPSLREIERRAAAAGEADGDSATGGASSSGTAQDRQGAPAAGSRISTSTGKVDQQNADVKIDPFAHVPGPVVVSNSVGAAKTLAQLFDPEEHGGEQQKTSSTGSAKGKKSLTEVSIFIEFANGFRKMPSSAGASSNTTTKAFLGQLTAAKHSKQPVLLMMGEIEEGPLTKWSPTKNPTLLLIDDANRIPYEAMSFVDGPKRAFEDCLCVIYTRADLKLTNGDVQAAAEAAIGQIDMNPFFLLGQKCVVLAVVVNKADETQVTAVRVLRKGPSCCGSTLIDEVFQHVPEGVTYFGPAASGKNSKEGSSVLSNKAKASQSKNKVVANLKLQEMSRHSAVCLIPPGAQPQLASFYAKVEAVRRDHDKAYHKWMPHVNLLFPFVKGFEANDATDGMKESPLLKSLQAACKKLSPFKIRFSRVGKFSQKGSATLHLVPEYVVQSTSSSLSKGGEENTTDFDDPMEGTPSCSSQGSFSQLIDAIEQALMDCGADKIVADQPRTGERGTADYFHPHLTLGQCASADADTRMQQFSTKIFGDADPTSPAFAPVEFVVDRLHIVGRPDGQAKMSVREEIGLGTGELLFATSPEVVNEDNINGTGTTGTNITVAKMLSNVRDWAFRGLLSDEGDFCGTTRTSSAAFAPPSRGSASTSVTSTAGPFVDCVGKILIPPGDYVPFSELAAFVDKSLFKPLLLQGLETEMKPKLAELTAAFHEENRINDMAAGIGELQLGTANNGTTSTSAGAPSTDEPQPVEDHSAPREVELATLRKQREQALLLRKHNAFEQELGKRLEGTVGPHLKSLLSHLEWVAFEGQVSSCRKSLASLWNEQIVPEILSLHATLVLTTEDETPLASSGGGDSAAAPLLSATSSAEGDVPMSIRTVPSTESASTAQKENTDRASPAISALTRAWQNGDLEAVRVAQQLKQMSAKIKRKCVYLARFFDLSSKRKNNATYAMIVELAAKNKRGARAQQKADTTKTNLSTLKNMSRDDFFDYYSQPEVCQTILHAVIDTLDSKTTFEHQVLAICGPNQDFLRTKPDAKLLRAVENRIAQRENKMKTISPAGSEQEPLQRQKNQTQGTSSGAFTGAATSAAASPTTSISPAICGVSNRMLTFEADVYSDIAAIPEATANIALNEQQGGGEKHAKTTLCYRPVQNTAPVIPIPIFARYAVQEGGEAEEIFMRKQTYIPWDEETAKPDVQMWRMAVAKVIQNSSSLQRVVTTQTGGGGELTIQNAQWVLVKILLDLSLVLHDRLRNVASLTPANRFDSVPSMLRSLVLTAIGITQAGDKPLGNAWSVCKNVPTRPELPEDKRDWYLLLVLATVFPKTGLDASCFRANLRRQLVRFFNKMCEPYIQELWKDYDARKKQYDADIAYPGKTPMIPIQFDAIAKQQSSNRVKTLSHLMQKMDGWEDGMGFFLGIS
ncbi:unnamed protein product [Amoebophrya sp. A120]|nr:unnamed protein product [Amoebophrya sp. A120]|eukprot:GSA120T00011611001.1